MIVLLYFKAVRINSILFLPPAAYLFYFFYPTHKLHVVGKAIFSRVRISVAWWIIPSEKLPRDSLYIFPFPKGCMCSKLPKLPQYISSQFCNQPNLLPSMPSYNLLDKLPKWAHSALTTGLQLFRRQQQLWCEDFFSQCLPAPKLIFRCSILDSLKHFWFIN